MTKSNRSLARGLGILRVFNESPRPTLTEISHRVGLTKATCLRFLRTLQEEGYVDYVEDLKRYQLRPLVLELGYAALASLSLPQVAAPEMQALADRTGGAVNLSVLDGDEIIVVARTVAHHEKRRLVTMNLHVGMRLPAHCTAMGRVLIGIAHPDLEGFVTGMRVEKLTPKTEVSRPQLLRAIREAAANGYEVVEDQLSLGYGAIAVPIRIPHRPPFALAVSMSTVDYSRAGLEREVLPALRETADRLTRAFAGGAQFGADPGVP